MAKKSVSISLFLLWLFLPVPAASQSITKARAKLCDRTLFHYDKGHGNQIEYYAPDGFAYLWYPGNWRSVRSLWKLEATGRKRRTTICFKYARNTYNPMTKQHGGKWECRPFSWFLKGTHKKSPVGDVFGLSTGTIPFRLDRHPKLNPGDLMKGKKPRQVDPACSAQ